MNPCKESIESICISTCNLLQLLHEVDGLQDVWFDLPTSGASKNGCQALRYVQHRTEIHSIWTDLSERWVPRFDTSWTVAPVLLRFKSHHSRPKNELDMLDDVLNFAPWPVLALCRQIQQINEFLGKRGLIKRCLRQDSMCQRHEIISYCKNHLAFPISSLEQQSLHHGLLERPRLVAPRRLTWSGMLPFFLPRLLRQPVSHPGRKRYFQIFIWLPFSPCGFISSHSDTWRQSRLIF